MRLCKDCRHISLCGDRARCMHPLAVQHDDLVHGLPRNPPAEHARNSIGKCGPTGALFEPRPFEGRYRRGPNGEQIPTLQPITGTGFDGCAVLLVALGSAALAAYFLLRNSL